MPLLAPKLVGPVTPVSPVLRVEHVLPGAWVEIHVDGTLAASTLATTNSVDVAIAGPLPPGGMATATWQLGGETSPPSLPQLVLNYPNDLAAPVYLSPVHADMDWVALGTLYPGATVVVRNTGGTVVGGPEPAAGATHRVPLHASIGEGEQLYAEQSVDTPESGTILGAKSESLPAEAWFPEEDEPPVPVVIGPVRECDGAVLVGGTVPGCWIRLTVSGNDIDFPAVAAEFWAVLPQPADAADTFIATNVLQRLGRDSGPSAVVPVDPAATLEAPRLAPDTQYCPRTVAVTASSLAPGSALTFELRGASGTVAAFRSGAPDDRRGDTYHLGDLSALVPKGPPFPAVVLAEQSCSQAVESNRAGVHRRPEQESPPALLGPPQACATAIQVSFAAGFVVTVHSAESHWPVLASFALVPTSGWVQLNRPLRHGEEVWVEVEAGCLPAHLLKSDPVQVEAADPDQLQVVEPVRPGRHRVVQLEGAVPGGRVHVFVNDRWRASAAVLPDSHLLPEVYVGYLNEEHTVTAVQTLCGRVSESSPDVAVQRGQLDLHASVDSVVRGVPTAVTVRAIDPDIGDEVGGLMVRGPAGDLGQVGWPFTVTADGTAASIRFTVEAEGYDRATLDLPVTGPPPPPGKTLTLRTHLGLGAHVVGQKIIEITWTLSGPGAPQSQTQNPQTTTCQFVFDVPDPGSSAVLYRLTGKATIEFVDPAWGTTLTRPVSVFYIQPSALRGWLDVVWSGVDSWREINIAWAPIWEAGVHVDSVFCFVLAADG